MTEDKPPAQPGVIERIEARADTGGTGMTVYDTDILIWSERQAVLLRRVGAGEMVNDQGS